MHIDIIKRPHFEDDSYLFNIENFSIKNFPIDDGYLNLKIKKFLEKDISKNGFEKFLKERGSLRFFDKIDDLGGSIYTYSVQERNGISYDEVISIVKEMIEKHPQTRRALVRIANSIVDYKKAEDIGYDVSCLSTIHYKDNRVTLSFRSSDIEYELFTDIITLYKFFIQPVYGINPIGLEIFGSTGQKVHYFDKLIKKIEGLK